MSENNSSSVSELKQSLVSMRQLRRSALTSIILMLIGVATIIITFYYSITRLQPLERQISALEHRITELNGQISERQRTQADIEDEIKQRTAELDSIIRQRDKALINERAKRQQLQNTFHESATQAGIRAYHRGQYGQAVKSYDEALRNDPNDAYLWNIRGYSLFKAGRYNEAVESLQKSIQVDPQYAWGYFDLARVYCKINRREDAADAMRKAIQLQPTMQEIMREDKEFTSLCGDLLQ